MRLDRDLLAPNAVARWARETPDAPLLAHIRGDRHTYTEVDASLNLWATALLDAGLSPGDHVASFVTDPIIAARIWLTCGRGGLVAVPINTANVGAMLRHVLVTSDAVAVLVTPDLLPVLTAVLPDAPLVRLVIVVGGPAAPGTQAMGDLLARVTAPRSFAGPEPHDTAMLLFTSGSTGPSKAVVVPWATAYGYWGWVPEDMLHPGESLYVPMTMFHISGLGALQHTASKGGCFVTRDRFSGTEFWEDIRSTNAVACGLVGPMTALLASAPETPHDADNPLRSVILGPMIPEMERFEKRFGVKVATCYGMTEVAPVLITGWEHGPWQNCGRMIEGWPFAEARIVDANDYEVPEGEVGELIVRTREPWALNGGYYGNGAATAEAWRNGWFHTGDAFRRDAEGWYYFVDRMKDTIRRRGENISSFEVEAAVLERQDVEACAAYGIPDTYGGHEVMIAVVPRAGAAIDVAELGADLAARMPKYMVPRYIDVIDDLPRNTTSLRVQKFVLRDRGVTASTWDRAAAGS